MRSGEKGQVSLYHYRIDDTVQAPSGPQYAPQGRSTVSVAFDAKVNPFMVNWTVVGARLKPCTSYTLVNVLDVYETPSPYWLVNRLGEKTTNRAGTLCMKGCTDELYEPVRYPQWGWYGANGWWMRFYGAEVWLVPTEDIYETGPQYGWDALYGPNTDDYAVDEDWWLASLGLPGDPPDFNFFAGEWQNWPVIGPYGAALGAGEETPFQKTAPAN